MRIPRFKSRRTVFCEIEKKETYIVTGILQIFGTFVHYSQAAHANTR